MSKNFHNEEHFYYIFDEDDIHTYRKKLNRPNNTKTLELVQTDKLPVFLNVLDELKKTYSYDTDSIKRLESLITAYKKYYRNLKLEKIL